MDFEVMAVTNGPAADRPNAAIGHWQPLGCRTVWVADQQAWNKYEEKIISMTQ